MTNLMRPIIIFKIMDNNINSSSNNNNIYIYI